MPQMMEGEGEVMVTMVKLSSSSFCWKAVTLLRKDYSFLLFPLVTTE
jgi:hypothetical protein